MSTPILSQITMSRERSVLNAFHDAELVGVRIANEEVIEIEIAQFRATSTVRLLGVKAFLADDFRLQNVVFEFVRHAYSVAMIMEILEPFGGKLTDPAVIDLLSKAKIGGAAVYELVSSVGFNFLCICERVEVLVEGVCVDVEWLP